MHIDQIERRVFRGFRRLHKALADHRRQHALRAVTVCREEKCIAAFILKGPCDRLG